MQGKAAAVPGPAHEGGGGGGMVPPLCRGRDWTMAGGAGVSV